MRHTGTHTQHAQYGITHLAKVEHQVELTDIAKELIQYLHKVVDGLEIAEVVVLEVQTEAEIQTSVSSVDSLEVTINALCGAMLLPFILNLGQIL